jgi:hypothetical protein
MPNRNEHHTLCSLVQFTETTSSPVQAMNTGKLSVEEESIGLKTLWALKIRQLCVRRRKNCLTVMPILAAGLFPVLRLCLNESGTWSMFLPTREGKWLPEGEPGQLAELVERFVREQGHRIPPMPPRPPMPPITSAL